MILTKKSYLIACVAMAFGDGDETSESFETKEDLVGGNFTEDLINEFTEDLKDEDTTPEPEPAESPEEAVPEEGEQEPVEEPVSEPEVKEPEPEPQPKQEPKPEVKPEPEVKGESKQPTEEEIKANQQAAYDELVKSFALSDEDATLMITKPEEIMPKLAANMYQRMATDFLGHVNQQLSSLVQQLPAYIQQVNTQTTAGQKYEDQFFAQFPGLKDRQAEVNALLQPGADGSENVFLAQAKQVIQAQGQQVTPELLMATVGRTIAAMLGVEAAPKVEEKQEVIPPQVHQPASAGSATNMQSQKPKSEFDMFLTEVIDEMR